VPEGTPYLAVVGPGQADERLMAEARAVGRAVAQAGAVLVCGGLGGVMAGACQGAVEAGGTTLGLLPGSDRAAANRWVTVAVATGLGELRNGLVVRSADAVVAVGGGWGTLSEIALAMKAGRPVVGVGTWLVEAPLGAVAPGEVVAAAGPAEAVAAALALAFPVTP
jgi:hypothetical protein